MEINKKPISIKKGNKQKMPVKQLKLIDPF